MAGVLPPIKLIYFGAFKELHGTLRTLQSASVFCSRQRAAVKCF